MPYGSGSPRIDGDTGTVFCAACGTAGYPDDKYCACCGKPTTRSCGSCGARVLQPVAYYCTQCGKPLAGTSPSGEVGLA